MSDRPDDEASDALDALFGEEEIEEEPRTTLRFDKTGALAGVPKLEPRRPYERPDRPGPEDLPPKLPPRPPGTTSSAARSGAAWTAEDERDDSDEAEEQARLPAGPFRAGEEGATREVGAFAIDRFPVTNADYAAFVAATGHRPPLYWPNGRMPDELSDHPVVGVDYYDAVAYARWKGKDLPYEDEWERAVRGTEGRLYPWGNETEPTEANTARLGLKTTTPVDWFALNVTPEGVHDLIGNAWEMTHSPARGGGIVLRGGSWFDFALYAKGWFAFASPPEARNGTIGFRLVSRDDPREDAPREVDPSTIDAAIAARRGPQPSIDPSTFAPEKRDLVPDYRRLRNMRLEREAERADAHHAALAGRPGPGGERRPRPPVKATLPPPIAPRPAPLHVGSVDDDVREAPAPTPAPARVRPAAGAPARARVPDAARATHVAPAAPAPPADEARRIPTPEPLDDRGGRLLFGVSVLLGLVLLGLLVAGFLAGAPQPDVVPVEDPLASPGETDDALGLAPEPPSRFPDPPAGDPRDAAAPRWLDAARQADRARLEAGRWLLVFADLSTPDGAATAARVARLARALRGEPLEVALVVGGAALAAQDGEAWLPPATRREILASLDVRGDLPVVLDAAGDGPGSGPGPLRRRWAVTAPQAALLLEDGHLAARSQASGALARPVLEALAARGLPQR